VNPEAYGLYLKGRHFFYQYTSDGWRQAIAHFTRAVEIDRQFAPAYSALADTYIVAGAYGAVPTDVALAHGKEAAAKALSIDGALASAHYVLAAVYTWFDWDWTNAERQFQRAIELNPNDSLGRNWRGGYLSLRGRHDEAIAEHERAIELDPLSLIAQANLVRALYWARRYEDAIARARRTLEVDPRFGVALFWLEGAMRHKGLFDEAVALREAAASTPEEAQEIAQTFATGGFESILRQTAERFRKAGEPVVAARCLSQLGDGEQALKLLEECAARRCTSLVNLSVEPDFDSLRSEPRFQALVAIVRGGTPASGDLK
jgi:tetratricopeptide (TPR) repeat protein